MITIAIPVFNRKTYTRNCLLSLRKQTSQAFKVVVTDDGSTDGTGAMLAEEFPEVTVITGDGNLWWAAGVNRAIAHALECCAADDLILVLNDDLLLPETYLETMATLAKAHPRTLIGSVFVAHDGETILDGGYRIDLLTAKIENIDQGRRLASFGRGHFTEVSSLTGRGTLIPSEVFRTCGLYNNKRYRQCADLELPLRARRAGYRLIVSYDAPVFAYQEDATHGRSAATSGRRSLLEYYFGVRSHANLKVRFWLAMDLTSNPAHGIWFFLLDFARNTYNIIGKGR